MINTDIPHALGLLILRLGVGGLMLFHGVAKVLHLDSLDFISNKLVAADLPAMLAYGVFIGEIVAPLMIIFGILSRIGGLLVSINILFAIFLVHSNELWQLTQHGGWQLELQAFYLVGGLAILLLGSGRYAVRPD
jgi:putative oxidoreductase